MPLDDETRRDNLETAVERAHLLEALVAVSDRALEFLQVVLSAVDIEDAKQRVRETFGFSDVQAMIVLDMQFRRMASFDRGRLVRELQDVRQAVRDLQD